MGNIHFLLPDLFIDLQDRNSQCLHAPLFYQGIILLNSPDFLLTRQLNFRIPYLIGCKKLGVIKFQPLLSNLPKVDAAQPSSDQN